jgi:CarboxypepD_reg-like domain
MQQIAIKIAEPCHENWNNMLPAERGKFCMSCQKTVVDFSVMTDQEILQHISTASGNICGRASNDQLNRVLSAPTELRYGRWRYWTGVAASFMLLSTRVNAQSATMGDTVITRLPAAEVLVGAIATITPPDKREKNHDVLVSGTVTDEANHPVPGATVMIKDTRKGTVTDANGFFSIRVDERRPAVLRISSIGYEMQDLVIKNENGRLSAPQVVLLKAVTMGLMGEIVVVAKPKRSWSKIFKKQTVQCTKPAVKESLSIYPNPVQTGATATLLATNLPPGNYMMAVYDAIGNPVEFREVKIATAAEKINLTCNKQFANGVLVINLSGNGKAVNTKCIVQ